MYLLPLVVLVVTVIFHGAASSSDPAVFQQPLITYRDANIAVEQSIGSPPQKLRLVVDLFSEGNGTTKIAGACCAACCSQRRFAPWKSSSFREINNDADVSILAEDITQFPNSVGDHIVFSTPIEVLNYDVTLWDWQRRLDGSASFLYRGKNTTFAEVLFKQVKSQLAIYAHRTCNDSYAIAGSVAYGTLQNDGCNPFKFQPLKQDQRGRIRFSMQKLSLGTLVVDAPPGGKTLLWSENVIAVPEAVFEQLNATLHARMDTNLRFFVDCRLNPGPLTLTFGDPSVTYSIPFSQLITNVDRVCELNIAISADTFFIGLPFLREYCVALDYENNHVGFASHQRSVTSECYYTSGSQPQWCPDTLPYECSFDATRSTPSSTSQSTTAVVATTKASGSTVYIQPLITYRDANFAVEQSIGYPPQKLRLVVDLFSGGTGTTKIAGACCAACCSQRRVLQPAPLCTVEIGIVSQNQQ